MIRASSLMLFVLLLSLTAVVLWLGYDAHNVLTHLDGAIVRGEAIETKANATLVNLDKGTAAWSASAKDQAAAITDLAVDAHGMISQADTAFASIPPLSRSLGDEAAALQRTTDAATGLAVALTGDAQTANTTIAAAQPVLAVYAQDGADLDALLRDQAIHRTLTAAAATLDNASGILADGRKVADKAAADFLKPVPWWKQPLAKGGELIDITAAIARHAP